MKLNEFVNSDLKDKLTILDTKLYYETAHLSSDKQIKETESYKEMLSYGNECVYLIVDRIVSGKGTFAHPILLMNITGVLKFIKDGDDITTKNFKKSVTEWWEENKHRYGK